MSEPVLTYACSSSVGFYSSCGCGYSVSMKERSWSSCDRPGHEKKSRLQAREAFKAFDEGREDARRRGAKVKRAKGYGKLP